MITFIFLGIVFLVITITIVGILSSYKQHAYTLSQMDRNEAVIVVVRYLSTRVEMYDFLNDEQIGYLVRNYLDNEIITITPFDKIMFGIKNSIWFHNFGLFTSITTIVLLVWKELWQSQINEKQEKINASSI